ncbi:MAG: hypothetical protein U5L96_11165 [Owenweeksia sp.]|nr:hypothetical protein [Owenweeksia sp.]
MAPLEDNQSVSLEKGPNIETLPQLDPLPAKAKVPVILKIGDNIYTDEILKAGAEVLPCASNLPAISKYSYIVIDDQLFTKELCPVCTRNRAIWWWRAKTRTRVPAVRHAGPGTAIPRASGRYCQELRSYSLAKSGELWHCTP